MNLENLEALKQAIQTGEIFDMKHFKNACGTPCCIAGHAQHLANMPLKSSSFALANFLNISIEDARAITFPRTRSPIDPYECSRNQACFLLDHYAETGTIDWHLAMEQPA
jgi:hypothetical protein